MWETKTLNLATAQITAMLETEPQSTRGLAAAAVVLITELLNDLVSELQNVVKYMPSDHV